MCLLEAPLAQTKTRENNHSRRVDSYLIAHLLSTWWNFKLVLQCKAIRKILKASLQLDQDERVVIVLLLKTLSNNPNTSLQAQATISNKFWALKTNYRFMEVLMLSQAVHQAELLRFHRPLNRHYVVKYITTRQVHLDQQLRKQAETLWELKMDPLLICCVSLILKMCNRDSK